MQLICSRAFTISANCGGFVVPGFSSIFRMATPFNISKQSTNLVEGKTYHMYTWYLLYANLRSRHDHTIIITIMISILMKPEAHTHVSYGECKPFLPWTFVSPELRCTKQTMQIIENLIAGWIGNTADVLKWALPGLNHLVWIPMCLLTKISVMVPILQPLLCKVSLDSDSDPVRGKRDLLQAKGEASVRNDLQGQALA